MADDVVDVKVEEADWEVASNPEEETVRVSLEDKRTKSNAWKTILESGQRQVLDVSLIEEVKKHPVIYDTMHPHIRDTFLKEKTWRQIGQGLNINPEYCKLRWKSIRDRFVKTEKQDRALKAKGLRKVSKPYRFASHLGFLRDFLRTNPNYQARKDVSIDIDDDVNHDSPSDKDNADDSSVSEYGWGPTNVVSASGIDNQLNLNTESAHNSLSNGLSHSRRRQRSQEVQNEPQVLYYDLPSPSGSRIPVGSHSSMSSSHSTPQSHSTSHPTATVGRDPPEGDPGYDEVTYFLMSLAPALRRLSPEQQSLARIKMQTLLHEMEFSK